MANRRDPFQGFRYIVEIEGIIQAGFSEVTIPDSTQEPIEYRVGTDLPTARKLPGLVKYGNVVLKAGVTDSLELSDWRSLVESGQIKDARRNMAIIILDDESNMAARWEFREAWPTKCDAPDLKANGNEIAIETLEIAHEGMKRIKV